jgi:P27 family predicted phage terminase small subunit
MTPGRARPPKPPAHLTLPTRRWWAQVVATYALEDHHVKILTAAAESWDRMVAAREAIDQHGLTYADRYGNPRARPEVAIERDARIGFVRCLRELALDVDAPGESRPPVMTGRR